jgi:hypothetical protein
VLLRLSYLALTNVFAFVRLLPVSDVNKDVEILALRHQLTVLQRQIDKPHLTAPDRAFLAALLHRLPRSTLRQLHLIVSPDTILRWHRDRDVLQRAPVPPRAPRSGAPAPAPRTDHRTKRIRSTRHPTTRPARRRPPRIPTRRLSCADEVFGTYTATPLTPST